MMAIRMPSVSGVMSSASLKAESRTIWSRRHLVLGALAIFMYVGAEVSIGSFLINFIALPEVAGIPEDRAANYLALYWGGRWLDVLSEAPLCVLSVLRLCWLLMPSQSFH